MKKISYLLLFVSTFVSIVFAQNTTGQQVYGGKTITTSVPFLGINADPISMGMGLANLGADATVGSYAFNPSKMAFQRKGVMFSSAYSPWLRSFNMNMRYTSTAVAIKINEKHSFGIDNRRFVIPMVSYTDIEGQTVFMASPKENVLGLMYAYSINNHFSVGTSLSFVNSNLKAPGMKVGRGVIGSISASYQNEKKTENLELSYRLGMAITNIGPKISYSTNGNGYFIPTNFGFGGAVRMRLFKYFLVNPALDFNKLLVPSPTSKGLSSDPYLLGVAKSGFDAEGGIKEEFQEINASVGTELGGFIPLKKDESAYLKLLLRMGSFNESAQKGNRKLLTFGLGGELAVSKLVLGLNIGKLAPVTQNSPLARTFSIGGSLGYML